MSVVVGVEDRDGVYLCADSLISADGESSQMDSPKIFRVGPMGIGIVGDVRHIQAVRYHLDVSVPHRGPLEPWCVRKLVPALKALCQEQSLWDEDEKEERGLTGLIAVRGQLFTLQPDWACAHLAEGYSAVGTGSACALGSLASTTGAALKRAQTAVKAAIRHCPSVGGKVRHLWVPK